MKKIAVIGSINMDMTATAGRIPRPGETISATSMRYVPGGKGANQAVAAARLGGDVTMFGCVGDDGFGSRLIENLQTNGVKTGHIDTVKDISSGIAMIVVAENDNAITVIPGANALVTEEYIDRHLDAILEADIILLQNEIPAETVAYAVSRMTEPAKHDHISKTDNSALSPETNRIIIYNPAPARPVDASLLDMVSFFTPNEHEARIVLDDETTPVEELIEKFRGRLIITLGSKGVAGYDKEYVQIPAIKAKVCDTTGAGDTMNGAFAYALSVGMGYTDALRFSNTAAGISTEKPGAQGGMPTLKEVKNRIAALSLQASLH